MKKIYKILHVDYEHPEAVVHMLCSENSFCVTSLDGNEHEGYEEEIYDYGDESMNVYKEGVDDGKTEEKYGDDYDHGAW